MITIPQLYCPAIASFNRRQFINSIYKSIGVILRPASADAEEKKLRAVLCGVFTPRTPDPWTKTCQLPPLLSLSFGGLQ